jgi:hypothetical protein
MIIGKQNPVVGVEEHYQISDLFPNTITILGGNNVQYLWYLWRKQTNGAWLDITKKEPKEGLKVTYKFGETFLGAQFKIQVYKAIKNALTQKFDARLFGELIIVPTSSKTPKIEQVVLFNGGKSDVNKAHYADNLTARAHCVAMFGQTVEFHLWEDDAAGGGHNAVANKNNRHIRTYPARVNEKGIAEVKISLSSDERILKAVANKYLMKGDKSEGKNHEYYVTATYHGKVQKASQKNVNVANTTGNREQPKPPQQAPAQRPTAPVSAPAPANPSRSQPRENTPTFPATRTSAAPRRPDPQGRIVDAYFVNTTNQKISQITVGDDIQIQIKSSNMVGKHIQYVIWEYDPASNDEIYRSGRIEVKGDTITTSAIKIDNIKFDKGYATKATVFGTPIDTDSVSQNYLIEVIPLDVSAASKKFGVDADGLMKVEQVKSPAMVRSAEVEGILDAYFAKKEYTKLTGEANGTHEYTFGGNKANNQTATAAQKEKVATTILGKVQESLKSNKKYTTKEAIIQSLTANEYGKDITAHKKVTFQAFKLGAELKKVANAL